MRTFKIFLEEKKDEEIKPSNKFSQMDKGFIPPRAMRPLIDAFTNSSNVEIMADTSKEIKLSKKVLYLCGGSVRDFLQNKTPKEYHLVTDATPTQVMYILNAAGFRMHDGANVPIPFKHKSASEKSKKSFEVKESSGDPTHVKVNIGEESFEIHTLNTDPKTPGRVSSNFTSALADDAEKRDLTVNSLYIELSKSDGENSKLFDPTNKGWHDIQHGIIRSVGSSKDRLEEDPSRALRAIRFQSKMGNSSKLDPDLEKNMKDMSSIEPKCCKDELMKSLAEDDIDLAKLIKMYNSHGLSEKLFPSMELNDDIPDSIAKCNDPHVKLSWMLKNNSSDNIKNAMGGVRSSLHGRYPTGWDSSDSDKVLFFINLDQLNNDGLGDAIHNQFGLSMSPKLIDSWVQGYNVSDEEGTLRQRRPAWAKKVEAMKKYRKW